MTQPWASRESPSTLTSSAPSVTLIEGSTFCISGLDGNILPGHAHGLFVRDVRVLSHWELTVDGATADSLAVQVEDPFAAVFPCRLPPRPGHADSTVLLVRRRYVGNGMREDLHVRNLADEDTTCTVTVAVGADFADLFEVKDGRAAQHGALLTARAESSTLRIDQRRGDHHGGVLVRGDGDPAITDGAVRWHLTMPARSEWTATIEVIPIFDGVPMTLRHPRGQAIEHTAPTRRLREWRRRSPDVRTADQNLAQTLRQSVEDLGALRIFDPEHPTRAVVAAGAPWFMALFGRDSLLTSWMLLPLDTRLAIGTLQTLAEHQGRTVDPASEEEPGRILHEMRFGPAATLALGGRNVYYGTADATPLFVMLLGELRRWGRHRREVDALIPHADRAMAWIEHFGDADGDGFVEYARKDPRGLLNQGWKDSWDGVNFADGRLAEPPIALAEVQGYTFAAYVARAHFAEERGDALTARHWAGKAERIKEAFNEAFWLPDRGWFAVGLDGAKRPIDALTSNIGHCLWTGIVADDKAEVVADLLLSEQMFSGWGIRTLATSMAAYNPMSYHNGSVWPHDNALCVAGLMRYGFVEHAQRVTQALLDAAEQFGHRLPELFCGFSRSEFPAPVPYPTSCSPQAWASAAPLYLLRSLLRFDPRVPTGRVWCAPAVPTRYLPLRVSGLGVGRWRLSIDVSAGGARVGGLDRADIRLEHRPRPATYDLLASARDLRP